MNIARLKTRATIRVVKKEYENEGGTFKIQFFQCVSKDQTSNRKIQKNK